MDMILVNGNKKSARYRAIKLIIGVKDDVYGSGLNSKSNQQRGCALGSPSCHHYVDPNNSVERIELLLLETKAGHDGLYDEMLYIYI